MRQNRLKTLNYVKNVGKKVPLRSVYFATDKTIISRPAVILSCPRLLIQLTGLKWIEFLDHSKHMQIKLRPGEILFCPPFTWTKPRWHLDGEFISLVYFKDYLRTIYVDQKNNQPRTKPDCYYHTNRPANPAALSLIHALEIMAKQKEIRDSATLIVRSLIKLAVSDISTDSSKKNSKVFNTWHMLSEYIHENYTQDITRQELAELFELHPGYISRLVKNRTGITLQEYIIQMRMELAKKFLEEPTAHVGNIAKMCGYHDISYFIKTFRRTFGVSPGRYHASTLNPKI